MSRVLLVRHAQANFGLGTYDRLSEHGQLQARHLGQVLVQREIQVDRIISGDLKRQRETASILSDALGSGQASIDPGWNEYEFMPLITRVRPVYRKQWLMVADLARSGKPSRRLQEIIDEALVAWVADEQDAAAVTVADVPAVETFSVYGARIQASLDAAAELPGTTVVVSSAGTIAAAVAPLIGVPPNAWPTLHRVMVNSSVTKVVRGRRGLSLVSFNEHGHLEGVPDVKITYR